MSYLQNRVALITGASKGIGRALALHLAQSGMKLALVGRSEPELQTLAQELGSTPHLICVGDVGNEKQVQNWIDTIVATWGSIDFLINNAGFGIFKSADELTLADWEAVFSTNTTGTFLMSKAVLPSMKQAKSGHIINVASDVAKRVFEQGSLYCASKYAQDAFSMALRKEVRPFGIKVSVVYSGLVDSMFHRDPQGADSHADWLKVDDIAKSIQFMMDQPKHVVIDELMIHPLSQPY
ncbi:MAG: SDR family oxidoreductase [Spirosomataceae bacterium]